MDIIEAGARELFVIAESACGIDRDAIDARWKNLPEAARAWYRGMARACWTAMVEELTDRQIWDLALPTPKVRAPFDCESPYHGSVVTERRAALLELTEVSDD